MKKFAIIFILAIIALCQCVGATSFAMTNNALAASLVSVAEQEAAEENKKDLIEADYNLYNYKSLHSVDESEVALTNRPFDSATQSMQSGASILALSDSSQRVDRTYLVDADIVSGESVYIYVMFTTINLHNLTITLSDGENSLQWAISDTYLEDELVMDVPNRNYLQYSWVKLQLPQSVAEASGQLTHASMLQIRYWSDDVAENVDYGSIYFYNPYIALSSSQTLAIYNRQQYYTYSLNFGEGMDTYCVGDTFVVPRLSNIFDYCIIGDYDAMTQSIDGAYNYSVVIEDPTSGQTTAFAITDTISTYNFENAGTYKITFLLQDKSGTYLDEQLLSVNVSNFSAVYILGGLTKAVAKKTTTYQICTSSIANIMVDSLKAESSDSSIASVRVENGRLVVETKKSGNVKITISVVASREHAQEYKTYSYSYTLAVTKATTQTNWWVYVILSATVVVAGIIAYYIMVNKRLIKNRYPKY